MSEFKDFLLSHKEPARLFMKAENEAEGTLLLCGFLLNNYLELLEKYEASNPQQRQNIRLGFKHMLAALDRAVERAAVCEGRGQG